jgi:hypothetical protein
VSGDMPRLRWGYHPAFNIRKFYGAIEMISGNTARERTRPPTRNDMTFPSKSFISSGDEAMLIYRVYESYFEDLLSLIDTDVTIDRLFEVLEGSPMFSSVFRSKYAELKKNGQYIAMTNKVVSLSKNDSRVMKGRYTVSCFVIIMCLDVS